MRGGRIALLLVSATLLLSGCSVKDAEKHLRFGWPTGVTKQAERMRVLWSWSGVAALALGVVVWGLIFWCCIRYRKKDDKLPRQTKYNLARSRSSASSSRSSSSSCCSGARSWSRTT